MEDAMKEISKTAKKTVKEHLNGQMGTNMSGLGRAANNRALVFGPVLRMVLNVKENGLMENDNDG
jgi:hypothetical protein